MRLTCACCGESTRGRQWWNRDTGFGVCPTCFQAEVRRTSREEAERLYGRAGEHHSLEGASDTMSTSQRIRNLSRTAEALRAFDEFDAKFRDRVVATRSNGIVEQLDAEHARLAREVGVAFGLDTSREFGGPNDPQVCADLIRPGPAVPAPGCELSFVRRMVRLWREQTNQPCDRPVTKSDEAGSSQPGETPKEPAP